MLPDMLFFITSISSQQGITLYDDDDDVDTDTEYGDDDIVIIGS
jgi:hypothetical protein